MKNKIALFLVGCLILILPSCIGPGTEYDYDIIPNCQIGSFSLEHSSISSLKTTKFTIDQLNGLIFNQDSLPYGTKIDKVVANVTYASSSSVRFAEVVQEAVNDSLKYWNGTDSLDFSKQVKFVITAINGLSKKNYTVQINVHQIVPDSMVWQRLVDLGETDERKIIPYIYNNTDYYYMYTSNGGTYKLQTSLASNPTNWTDVGTLTGLPANQIVLSCITEYEGALYVTSKTGNLYRSTDGRNWGQVISAPDIRVLLGVVKEEATAKLPSALAAIGQKDGSFYFKSMNKSGEWTEGDVVYEAFPVTGFGTTTYNSMYREYLLLAGGRTKANALTSAVWTTMNGISWSLIKDSEPAYFEIREGLMLTNYDDKLFLLGGMGADGNAYKDIYLSKDKGISWVKTDSLVIMPEAYNPKAFASMIVDKETNYMYLFGGKETNGGKDLGEFWRGRINRLGFGK